MHSLRSSSTPVISSIQPSCFKNLSIFRSDTPYIVQKMGELICIDYQRCSSLKGDLTQGPIPLCLASSSLYFQQPTVKTLDPSVFLRTINAANSVAASPSLPTDLTRYEVRCSIAIDNRHIVCVSLVGRHCLDSKYAGHWSAFLLPTNSAICKSSMLGL